MTGSGSVPFVIAVDSGGTYTRVECFGLDGSSLSAARGAGGSPYHNTDAARNVTETVARCIHLAGVEAAGAVALVAGIAQVVRPGEGRGGEADRVADFFAVPSLDCPRLVVNDATIAHRGALLGAPGVVVVAGTGSMTLAITEDDTEVDSGRFEHYAGGARHLAYEATQLVLTDAATSDDGDFVATLLAHWGAADVRHLRHEVLRLANDDRREVRRRYGALAPAVTAAADSSPLADAALRVLADRTARGVQLLVPLIEQTPARLATVGALAETSAFRSRLADALDNGARSTATLVESSVDSLGGAAIMAYRLVGLPVPAALTGAGAQAAR